ncbi:ribulose bisphosphate carboxylase small subunit [Microcoleus sp. FACHB-672]|uniref:ribulose bisphosphate carboxylase small subunit n=1 Tax=Microcoleus sp. FACHB-672 TaxID=2692825 RepID=UPI001681ECB9|nr:ribulose bisphosphate carboxylase small subunit [Microcoleus sp. FACHB-672]MBD2042083.1 ribulose bisphosphate carboxylase small subunit [Microcoleus sp. FACHB-672]
MTYYISPRFLDKVAVHITKNFLDLPKVRVPLILGIHGRKGEGKTFQCEQIFQRMGIEVIHMSAGELESPDAGDPSRLVRLRYREAAELIKVRGKMCVLMINDLDAGAGRFDSTTQYTVNTQMVNGTLMNIADNPTNVQLPGSYDSTPLHRVPILVTGNDFSTLYEPLIRDGRMEKFYWEPDRDDRVGIVSGIFEQDELSRKDVEKLVDTFPNQAIDFYGALRARLYDEQIREFIYKTGIERISSRVANSSEGKPQFPKPDFSLSRLIEFGNLMSQEQQRVLKTGLAKEYNQVLRSNNQPGNQPANQSGNQPSSYQPANQSGNQPSSYQSANQSRNQPTNQSSSYQPTNQLSSTEREAQKAVDRNEIANDPTHVAAYQQVTHAGNGHNSQLSTEVMEQLQQIVRGGYRLGIEYVDQRRFRTNSWISCASIPANQESEAISALEACLHEHSGDYVRLIGIEPNSKRRVVESIIHRPKS